MLPHLQTTAAMRSETPPPLFCESPACSYYMKGRRRMHRWPILQAIFVPAQATALHAKLTLTLVPSNPWPGVYFLRSKLHQELCAAGLYVCKEGE